MTELEIAGFAASLVIGMALGLIGGGGSILTVPVLVYLFGIQPVTATAYSLFIVGTTSLVGALPKYRQGYVDLRTAIVFGFPSLISVFLTRRFVVPAIPEVVFRADGFAVTKDLLLMLLFAILMVLAAVSMIRERSGEAGKTTPPRFHYLLIFLEGLVVGALTGLVGAGGGFLIIPALVLLARLPMKKAVGTSLLIIAAKSLIGFTGDIPNLDMDWKFLFLISGIAVGGIFIGNVLNSYIEADPLKKGFGWFVLVMGSYIIIKELLFPGHF